MSTVLNEETNLGKEKGDTINTGRDAKGLLLGDVQIMPKGGVQYITVASNTDPVEIPLGFRFWKWEWKNDKSGLQDCELFLRVYRQYVTIRFLLLLLLYGGLTVAYLRIHTTCKPGPVRTTILVTLWIFNAVILGHRLHFYSKRFLRTNRMKRSYESLPVKETIMKETALELKENAEQSPSTEKEEEERELKLKRTRKDVEGLVKEAFCVSITVDLLNLLAFGALMAYQNKKCISMPKYQFQLTAVIGSAVLIVMYFFGEISKYLICKNSIKSNMTKFYRWTVFEIVCLTAIIICTANASQKLKKDVLLDRIFLATKAHCEHDSRPDILGRFSFPITSSSLVQLRLNELHGDTNSRHYKIKNEDVNFENLLKTEEKNPCTHTIIEGENFSGKTFLARKLCYVFVTNNQSEYRKNFDLVLEISLLSQNGKESLKELALNRLKTLAGDDYSDLKIREIEKTLYLERILFIITDISSEDQRSMVEFFINGMEKAFPKSSSLTFSDPFEFLKSKLNCLYKITGITPESRKQVLRTITSEKCSEVIETIIEQRKSRFNEEYHLGQIAMLAASCDRISKKSIIIRTVLNNYAEHAQHQCSLDDKEFSSLMQHGFKTCLKGKKCHISKSEIVDVIRQGDQTRVELRNCVLLTKAQKRDGQLLYRFRRSFLLFSIVKLRNEDLLESRPDDVIRSTIKDTLNHVPTHPIRAFISDAGPMFCLYGSLVEVLFCVNHLSGLSKGYFLTQAEVEYVHLETILRTARFPLPGETKWSSTINILSQLCRDELSNINIDTDCTEDSFEISQNNPKDHDDESQFFLSSRNCAEICRAKQIYISTTENVENVSYVLARYRYEFKENCPAKLRPEPYFFVRKVFSLVSQFKNIRFLTLELTDSEYNVPNHILQATYHEKQGVRVFICKADSTTGLFAISEACADFIQKGDSAVCKDIINGLFKETTIGSVGGTIKMKSDSMSLKCAV